MDTITTPLPDTGAAVPTDSVAPPPGLKGVVVADTAVGDVRGAEGFFHYRQYSAVDLARTRTFDDVWFLLETGRLPDVAERSAFAHEIGRARRLPVAVVDALPAVSRAVPTSLGGLLAGLGLAAGAMELHPLLDLEVDERRAEARRLAAVVPTLVAAVHRLRLGLDPVAPDPELGHAADYLRMVTGTRPAPAEAAALDRYLTLTADHGFNASTFTARVIASTGADLGACVTGALGALSGPLHGGAPSRALDLLDEIGQPDRAGAVVGAALDRGERIMGFGHAVYQGDDPRSLLLRDIALELGGERASLAHAAESAVVAELDRRRPERRLRTNVEFYAGVVMERCGLPPDLFTPTFAVSRTVGWVTHALEQAATRRLIRPSARYVGPDAPAPVPEVP